MADARLERIRAKAFEEGKRLLGISAYFWVLLTMFSLHKAFMLNLNVFSFQQAAAIINALAMSKVVVIAQALHFGQGYRNKPLVYPVVLQAAVFSVLLLVFHLIEETLIGKWHGKTLAQSVPTLGDGSLQALMMIEIILFVALIPFFAFLEMERVVGWETLHTLFFGRKYQR
ncbi:hypothetical protein [Methylocystis heyeri]|uniref:Uncharacterized protein n=1 Tax=Methylocystis heyeri TaxID=391905 RepID=A0A6B8KJP7_9HYPH|nr:hypothetical protein [Methylocystis heyeri]QGM47301.1 hypothetical protein H2LOC_017285 [Methylocystis heyeri]